MKLGIVTPGLTLLPRAHAQWEETATFADIVAIVQEADRLGYHHCTCSEHVAVPVDIAAVRGGRYFDPLATFVGNVEDGRISVFNSRTGKFLGQLKDVKGNTIAIDGLWALVFGAGSAANGKTNQLFFTAGPANTNGFFGQITAH